MRQRSGLIFLVLGVLAAALAGYVAMQITQASSRTVPVVVALRDLAPYQRVTVADVQMRDWPMASVPADAARRIEDVVGRYTRDAIYAGEVIRGRRLAAGGESGLLAADLTDLKDPTLRAFALPYDAESAVGGQLHPGDRVDLVASVRIDTGKGVFLGVGKIIAANVRVLRVDPAKNSTGDPKGTVTVALKPDQIEDVAFALTSGQLRFALNPYNTDVAAARTEGVTGKAWLDKYGFSAAVQK